MKTHGMSGTATYRAWMMMIQRCSNSQNNRYESYGERGIVVCERWTKFVNFFTDMGAKPIGLMLERKNNDLGYFKKNCCWATPAIQARNQRVQKNNKLGIRGISLRSSGKYQVRIWSNNKSHYIGYFTDLEQAMIARKQAELKYWGKCFG